MFSQTTEYALRAMCCLALRPNATTPTAELAGRACVSSDYLSKVLQALATARLVVARRGVGGGYRLARPAREIRLSDVVMAVGGLRRIKTCPLGLPSHGSNLCPLHRAIDRAAEAVEEILGAHTLGDIVEQPGVNVPLCESVPAATLTVSVRSKPKRSSSSG